MSTTALDHCPVHPSSHPACPQCIIAKRTAEKLAAAQPAPVVEHEEEHSK